MRELKFRIMYKNHRNVWIKNEYTLKDLLEMDGNGFLDDDDIIEQFTGLKDRNGKEIYEGDIVRRCEEGGFNDIVGVVEWSEKAARFWVNSYYYPNGKNWVVVGNIHENPELLKGEEDNG